MLRKALTHRAPSADRTRYRGPLESEAGGDLDPSAAGPAG